MKKDRNDIYIKEKENLFKKITSIKKELKDFNKLTMKQVISKKKLLKSYMEALNE